MKTTILLIEDDASIVSALKKVLVAEGYEVDTASRGDEGLEQALRSNYAVVITDLRMPGLNGLELVERLHQAKPKQPILLMTAHGTTETAIEATKLGAYDYLVKPLKADELLDLVKAGADGSRFMSEPVEIGEARVDRSAIIGKSRAMQEVYKAIGRVAATPATVLIRGDTGTGKELVARAIYQHSDRVQKPFIAVNCAAIPDTLLESELFGHERGAFTGAQARRIGRFEQADGGTIFLDEIGDLNPNTQGKLLRVLQERCIQRLGSEGSIPIDVRVLAATHRDLEAAIAEKAFREDLFYRISVVSITLPSLSQRAEDIPALVHYFLHRYAVELGMAAPSIVPEAVEFLQSQTWPGNVRELENTVRQALLAARPFAVGRLHVQEVLRKARRPVAQQQQTHAAYVSELLARAQSGDLLDAYARMIEDMEPELFRQAIELAHGNQAKAARWLGVTRLKMREKLVQFGLHPGRADENHLA
ncbi:MAG: sigma-54 dependent transcriptional regulator [Verrucomicrobia bacterium]|nr:sigma-54 dependent transcriptional regulator [Verrucomicrobiota bacterium]